jgi:hypothetical protein
LEETEVEKIETQGKGCKKEAFANKAITRGGESEEIAS